MNRLPRLLLLLALTCAAAVAVSGYGARLAMWDFRVGFSILRWATFAAIAVVVFAIIALLVPALRRAGAWRLGIALAIAAAGAALPLFWLQQARALPPINDITTDTTDPPTFVAIAPLRRDAPVPSAYAGAQAAAAQLAAYPDVRPVLTRRDPAAAFDAALAAARAMGWEIVDADAGARRIEAVATTPWFGFKDDVVIRVRSQAAGSRIDVRSVSRVGKGDLGANAHRIRAYVALIKP